jgi:biopolymer transport protein ExbD
MAMLLLIFFVVCGRMSSRTGVPLDPPRSFTADPLDARPAVITVSAEGLLYLEGRPIDAQTLRDELEALLSQRVDKAGRTVHVEVDRRTPYRSYVVAVDAVNHAKGYVELKVIR